MVRELMIGYVMNAIFRSFWFGIVGACLPVYRAVDVVLGS